MSLTQHVATGSSFKAKCAEPAVVWQRWPVPQPVTSLSPQFWTCSANDHTIYRRLRFKTARNCHVSIVHWRFSAPSETKTWLQETQIFNIYLSFLTYIPRVLWKFLQVKSLHGRKSLNPGLDDKLHSHGNNSEYFKNYSRQCMWVISVNCLINWIPFHKSVC